MFLSKVVYTPPKTPRNVYFPWQVFCVHRSGSFLERNRLAIRVPINLTKFEIREYLRKIYNAKVIKVNTLIKIPERRRCLTDFRYNYYRNGPMYKKAIITLEHPVDDSVKMISSCRNIGRNPAITKQNVSYGDNSTLKLKVNRKQLWAMGECRYSWRLPLPNLLAGDDWNMNPMSRVDEDLSQMYPDVSKPFIHSGLPDKRTFTPENIPTQTFPTMDLTPWRKRVQRLIDSGTLAPKHSSPGNPGGMQLLSLSSSPSSSAAVSEKSHSEKKSSQPTPWIPPS